MKLRTKISLNFALIAALMVIIGSGSILMSRELGQQGARVKEKALPALDALNQTREQVWDLWRIREQRGDVEAAFRSLESSVITFRRVSGAPAAADHARLILEEILELQEVFYGLSSEEFQERAYTLNAKLSAAIREESGSLEQLAMRSLRTGQRVTGLSIILITTAVLLCLLPGWGLAAGVSKAFVNAQQAADRVAEGDLSKQMSEHGTSEISMLAAAFNRMVETIRQADEEISREVDDRIRAERKAQVAAKAKSDFLAHMSHEFRTPLNGILGYSQMLAMDKGLSEKNRDVVKSLQKSGESLLELINDVLDLSKIEANKMHVMKTRFYLGDFLESLEQSYAEQIKRKGLEFKLHIQEGVPEDILADQIRLRQVLVNLLGNAVKFTDKGEIGISVTPISDGVRFAVFDSGMGIAPEDHSAILEPFQQSGKQDQQQQGTGLGLPISSRLLELMDSKLQIKSEPGEGSTFWFDLPQPDIKTRKLVRSHTQITGYEGPVRRVLVGEEGKGTAAMLMPLLQKVGFETLQEPEPDRLVEKALLFKPDILLVDLYFSGKDGVDLLNDLHVAFDRLNENSAPPAILFSDHRKPDDRERALRSGAAAFLGSPVRFADLMDTLRSELSLAWREKESAAEEDPVDSKPASEVIPLVEDLTRLLVITRSGNVRKLRETLMEMKTGDANLDRFCDRLLDLTAEYRLNAILKELEERSENPLEKRND